jgi:hypothetical protein
MRPTHRSRLLVPGGKIEDLALLHCEWALGLDRFADLRESRLAAGVPGDARPVELIGEHGDRWFFRFSLPTAHGKRSSAVRISPMDGGLLVEHLIVNEDTHQHVEPTADSPETTRALLELPDVQPAMLRGVAPVVLGERDVPALVVDALEPRREAPIILVSVDNGTHEPLVDPRELSRRLAGMARVVWLSTVSASRRRTLRKAVLPYIQYTARRSMTWKFKSSPAERELYQAVSDFLSRDELISLPLQQRGLITMVLRKLLASSTRAIAGGLAKLRDRLESEDKREKDPADDFADEAFDEDWLDDLTDNLITRVEGAPGWTVTEEIAELDRLLVMAKSIEVDRRALALVDALRSGFAEMRKLGAAEKAVIFTESRRTQAWLKTFLEGNGYNGKIVCFNGSNSDPETRAILDAWEKQHPDAQATGSRATNVRAAIVDSFRDQATLLIATEAGAEGLNLQMASLVVNYDLPWNPQRIEQRIGRCHRYGQRFDVVVVNFLDQLNRADERVLELLTDKCQLFDGVFGASDEVLGTIESGVGLEVKIHRIFRTCRTPEAIEAAFAELRAEMDEVIKRREASARQALLDHFDADVHDKLKLRLDEALVRLDRIGRQFWSLTRWALVDVASFADDGYRFELQHAPAPGLRPGRYELVSRETQDVAEAFVYRLSHPLGEHVLHAGLTAATPPQRVAFVISSHPLKVSVVEALKGKSGWLTLERMRVTGLQDEEHLLLSGCVEGGRDLDAETLDRLLSVGGRVVDNAELEPPSPHLDAAAERLRKATLSQAAERSRSEFNETRERLERWADDQIRGAEATISEIRRELRAMERRARQAETLEEQRDIQRQIIDVEARQRKARTRVFSIEDEVREKRTQLMDELDRRVAQNSTFETIYRIAWTVE